MNQRPICAMAVCHKDLAQTWYWRSWNAWLAGLEGGSLAGETMVTMFSQRASTAIADMPSRSDGDFEHHDLVCADECEDGYPKSASHLFLRLLEHCEREYPGRPVLFCEPDTVPTRPGWFSEIAREYEGCGHPFMSQRIRHPVGTGQHLMGNAVYAADWRSRAPRIATVLSAPDNSLWGPGHGQPWDVWAGGETAADMHESGLFQQIFSCTPWTPDNLNRLNAGTALFHRCKDGTLIAQLARTKYPGFAETLAAGPAYFQMTGHPSRLKCLGYPEVGYWDSVQRPAGWVSVCAVDDPIEQMILRCLSGTKGILTVSEEEFTRFGGRRRVAAAAG